MGASPYPFMGLTALLLSQLFRHVMWKLWERRLASIWSLVIHHQWFACDSRSISMVLLWHTHALWCWNSRQSCICHTKQKSTMKTGIEINSKNSEKYKKERKRKVVSLELCLPFHLWIGSKGIRHHKRITNQLWIHPAERWKEMKAGRSYITALLIAHSQRKVNNLMWAQSCYLSDEKENLRWSDGDSSGIGWHYLWIIISILSFGRLFTLFSVIN